METAVCMKDIFHVRCISYLVLSCIIILAGISMMFFSPDTVSAAALMAGIIFILNGVIDINFGACGAKFSTYLTAGISGSLLSIVTTTLLGTKLSNPFSIEFIMVLLLRILVSAGTVVLKHYRIKEQERNEKNE